MTKYDPTGSIQWTRQFGTNYSFGMAVSANQPGSIYVSGLTGDTLAPTTGSGEDAFLIRYDDTGNRLWTRQLGTNAIDRSYGVAADASNIFIGGWTTGSLGGANTGGSDVFVSKYSTSGALQWTRQLGSTGSDECHGISADGQGNVYIAGFTNGNLGGVNAGSLDGFVGKYDAAGGLVWLRQLGTSAWDVINSVYADGMGNVYFSGYTEPGLHSTADALLGKYDQYGNLLWLKQFGGAWAEVSVGVSADGRGNVYIAGWTDGPRSGMYVGDEDAFAAKFDDVGDQQWFQQLGTSTADSSSGVAADSFGNIYFEGYTGGSLAGPNAGQYDAFVAKISDVPEPAPFSFLLAFVAVSTKQRFRRRPLS